MPITAFEVGWVGKIEAAYGTAETLSNSADGILPYIADDGPEAPTPVEYVFDGNIGRNPGSGPAPAPRIPPAGRFHAFEIPVLFRGNGDAYDGSTFPPNEVHTLLRAAGFDATLNTDEYRYTLTPLGATFKGATIRRYMHGAQWQTEGTLFDLNLEAQGLGAPMVRFAGRGKMGTLPATASLPTIALPQQLIFPALSQGVVGNLGDFAFGGAETLRSVSFALNRSVDNPRIAQNLAGGHAGFWAGYVRPTWTVVMERTAKVLTPFHTTAGLDVEALREAATSVPLAFQYGTTSTERWTMGSEQVQLGNVSSSNDGGLALVTLEFVGHEGDGDACYFLWD